MRHLVTPIHNDYLSVTVFFPFFFYTPLTFVVRVPILVLGQTKIGLLLKNKL